MTEPEVGIDHAGIPVPVLNVSTAPEAGLASQAELARRLADAKKNIRRWTEEP